MNNFGRTVLALGLGTVMTFTNPECFFQAESEPTMVYAAEKAAVQGRKLTVQSRSSISVRVSADCLGKSESTTEVTTKKEEGTKASSEKNTEGSSTGKDESQTNHTTGSTHTTSGSGTSSGTEGSSGSGSQTEEVLHQEVLYLEAVRQEVRHLRMAHRAAALQTMLRIRQSRLAVRHLGQMDRQIVIRIRHRIRILII